MRIDYDYLSRIRRAVAIYTKRKTSDILEGDFRSIAHGRSLEFDDLREYRAGDDVNDIDWKSSSRTGKTLVRRYMADRRHSVMFVGDTGSKMLGDTPAGERKEDIALMAFGMAAYLTGRQGASYALTYSGAQQDMLSPFRFDPQHLENLMHAYEEAIESGEPKRSLSETLTRMVSSINRRMVIFIITDAEGLAELDETVIRRLAYRNDVCVLKIEDAFLTTPNAFDLMLGRREDSFMTGSSRLHEAEVKLRKEMDEKARKTCTPHRVLIESVSREEDIIEVLMHFSQRQKGAGV